MGVRGIFWNKKGYDEENQPLIIYALIGLIFGVGLSFIYIYVAKGYATGEIYSQVYLVKDFALIIDSMYSVPGTVFLAYKEDIGTNIVDIRQNYVTLNPKSSDEIKYPYIGDRQALEVYFSNRDSLNIRKSGYDIIFEDLGDTQAASYCLPLSSKISRVLIDFSGSNTAYVDFSGNSQKISEHDVAAAIAEQISTGLSFGGSEVSVNTQSGDNYMDLAKAHFSEYNFLIFLRLSDDPDPESNAVSIYVNDDANSIAAGCFLQNYLSANDFFTRSRINVVDGSSFDSSSKYYPLSVSGNIIYIEAGNINSRSADNPASHTSQIAQSIKDAFSNMGEVSR